MTKEIKHKLKEAKEFIKDKDYEQAIQCCKEILREDRKNYTAFVFVGVCAQELGKCDQAIKAFKQAIDISPDQLLGWQGLANFYEKVQPTGFTADLAEVYIKLLPLYLGEKDKFKETLQQLCDLTKTSGGAEQYCTALSDLLVRLSENDKLTQELIHIKLEEVMRSLGLKGMSESMKSQYVETFHFLQEHGQVIEDQIKLYLQIVKISSLKMFCYSCLELGAEIGNKETGIYPLESYIKVHLEVLLGVVDDPDGCVRVDMVDVMANKLSEKKQSSPYLELLRAWHYWWEDKDVVQAVSQLDRALKAIPNSGLSWLMLSKIQLEAGDYNASKKSAALGLKALARAKVDMDSKLAFLLKHTLLKSYLLMGDLKNFRMALKTVNCADPEVCLLMAQAYKNEKKSEELSEILTVMEEGSSSEEHLTLVRSWIHQLAGDSKEALRLLKNGCDQARSSLLAVELGKLLYEVEDHDSCYDVFSKCVRDHPDTFESYVYLGHLYFYHQEDYMEAKYYYLRGFQLCPYSSVTGRCLSDVYSRLGMEAENLRLLEYTVVNKQCSDLSWAWSRLGMQYLRSGRDTEAVAVLQSALTCNPNDRTLWEALGDAYVARGSYGSALKTFEKARTIRDQPTPYCLHSIASIKQRLGMLLEAVQDFRDLLSVHPDFIPGFKGLGETLVLLGKHNLAQMFDGCATDCCQEAVDVLSRLVERRPDLVCGWKLLGDACFLARSLPRQKVRVEVPANLTSGSTEVMQKEQLLRLGTRCYFQAVKMYPESGSGFYDLGIAFFYLAVEREEQERASKQDEEMALKMMKKAIDLEPNNDRYWNGLGIVAGSKGLKNNAVAQHAFIRATTLNPNNAQAWSNLGALYLSVKDYGLAHEAFKMSQNADPEHAQGWIGQALVADELAPEEAMDLYRHSCGLSRHPLSLLGYSHWVCSTLLDDRAMASAYTRYAVEGLHATSVALDCMLHYNGRRHDQPCALNLLGVLAEREGLMRTAEDAYTTALSLVERGDLVEVWGEEDKLSLVTRKNLGRLLCSRGKYGDAVEVLLQVKDPDFEVNATLALAYFLDGRYQEAYSYYESVLHWLDTGDGVKSQILVAMAVIAFKFQGADAAKTLLFQSCQLRPPCVEGTLALGAIGLLTEDPTLFSAAIQEMEPHRLSVDYIGHYSFLQACQEILNGSLLKARRSLCRALHVRPDCAALWKYLFLVLWNSASGPLQAARCLLSAWKGMKHDSDMLAVFPICHLMGGDKKSALQAAKKAAHLNPGSSSCWASLAAILFTDSGTPAGAWALKLVSWLRRRGQTNKPMNQWLAAYDRKAEKILSES